LIEWKARRKRQRLAGVHCVGISHLLNHGRRFLDRSGANT
jgi:hypothetical protein